MGATYSTTLSVSPPVSWKTLQCGVQYKSTDVAVLPHLFPLAQWFTAQEATVLAQQLRRRTRTNMLTEHEFAAWLLRADGDPQSILLHQSATRPLCPDDVLAVPAPLQITGQASTPQEQNASLLMEMYVAHVFHAFLRPNSRKVYALEFLAALVVISRAVWDLDQKLQLLIDLFYDRARSSCGPQISMEKRLKEADVAQLVLCVMNGVAKVTMGVQRVWTAFGLETVSLARHLAADCMNYASNEKSGRTITASQLTTFVRSKAELLHFLALFGGEELRNPFTFGVLRSPCTGLAIPDAYAPMLDHQTQLYDRLVAQYVSFDGRQDKRSQAAALLIQSTWRRRCSQSLLGLRKDEYTRQRHISAATLQRGLKQCQFARLVQKHAEAERQAFNGGVLVAGSGACVPGNGSRGMPAMALRLVDAFKLNQVQILSVSLSQTCALALGGDGRTLYVWGNCLPRVYSQDTTTEEDASVSLLGPVPRSLAFAFPAKRQVLQLGCGLQHALALTDDGMVFSWGFNDHGQLGHGPAETLSARTNGQTTYALHYDPRDGRTSEFLAKPTPLLYFFGAPTQHADPIPIQQVCCGDYYSMALSRDGDVFTWGEASEGQLGHGDAHPAFQVAFVDPHMMNSAFTFLSQPEPVLALNDLQVVQIGCRKNHSVALTSDSRLLEWGNWGKRRGTDCEHAFEPVELSRESVQALQLRQMAVGDHHIVAEGSSAWLSLAKDQEQPLAATGIDRAMYMACAAYSCPLDKLEAMAEDGNTWTCVFLDAEIEDIEDHDDCDFPPTQEIENVDDSSSRGSLSSFAAGDLWKKRVAPFALTPTDQRARFARQVGSHRVSSDGDSSYARALASWLEGRAENRLVVVQRGKSAGLYIQILGASTGTKSTDFSGNTVGSASELNANMLEFAVVGSSTAHACQLTPLGFATRIYHRSMREDVARKARKRLHAQQVIASLENHSLWVIEFNESSVELEYDGDDGERALLGDWTQCVLDAMSQQVLAAQEAGALSVLLVLDFFGAKPFELQLQTDSGIYIPVFMIKRDTSAVWAASSASATAADPEAKRTPPSFAQVLERLLVSPTRSSGSVVRCFQRVDTLQKRIDAALTYGARGVIVVQDSSSLEMDGETVGAPIFCELPSQQPHHFSDRLVAMVSAANGERLYAAAKLTPMDSGASYDLILDVQLTVRSGGTTYAWGNAQNGRLGIGQATEIFQDGYEALTDTAYRFVDRPTALAVLAGQELRQLVCGSAHALAVTTTGKVFAWGKGKRGELAQRGGAQSITRKCSRLRQPLEDQWIPRPVSGLHYETIVHAAANDACSMFVTETASSSIYRERRRTLAQLKALARRKREEMRTNVVL